MEQVEPPIPENEKNANKNLNICLKSLPWINMKCAGNEQLLFSSGKAISEPNVALVVDNWTINYYWWFPAFKRWFTGGSTNTRLNLPPDGFQLLKDNLFANRAASNCTHDHQWRGLRTLKREKVNLDCMSDNQNLIPHMITGAFSRKKVLKRIRRPDTGSDLTALVSAWGGGPDRHGHRTVPTPP